MKLGNYVEKEVGKGMRNCGPCYLSREVIFFMIYVKCFMSRLWFGVVDLNLSFASECGNRSKS